MAVVSARTNWFYECGNAELRMDGGICGYDSGLLEMGSFTPWLVYSLLHSEVWRK